MKFPWFKVVAFGVVTLGLLVVGAVATAQTGGTLR